MHRGPRNWYDKPLPPSEGRKHQSTGLDLSDLPANPRAGAIALTGDGSTEDYRNYMREYMRRYRASNRERESERVSACA